jgi:hypothetical protein
MNRIVLAIVALAVNTAVFASPDSLRLEGEPFHPNVPIAWAATNYQSKSVAVYKTIQQAFPQTVISNAMAIGSFKPINLIQSQDKSLMLFQDHRDKSEMTRFLKISPLRGWINYYNGRAEGTPIKGVPTFEEAEILATDYLQRLGVEPNHIIPKPWPRTEKTITSFDKKGGHETNKVVSMRGVFLFRQIDGIQIVGNSFRIEFGNDAKPFSFEFSWPALQPLRRYQSANPGEIMRWMKAGRAVDPNPNTHPIEAKAFTIAKAILLYQGNVEGVAQDIIYPFAQIEMLADTGTNNVTFTVNCPIIDTDSQPK